MKVKPVSIIIPTLNEKENITKLISSINRVFYPLEILIVDDNSIDGTVEKILFYKKTAGKNVHLIINQKPIGLTNSIQKGINRAKGKIVAWMDADFSHPPELLQSLYNALNDCDIAVASRYINGGKDKRKEKLAKICSLIINYLCHYLFNLKFYSFTSGYAMAKKEILRNYRLRGDYGEYFIDFIVTSFRQKKRIKEIPYICYSRNTGVSKTSTNFIGYFVKGYKYAFMILKLILKV